MQKWVNKFQRLATLKLKKNRLHHHEAPIFAQDVDFEKVLVSNNISFGEQKL